MPFPCPLVRVDSKYHFQYVEDCIPANRAVVQLLGDQYGKLTPTGVVLIYRLLTMDDAGTELQGAVLDTMTSVEKAYDGIFNHARMCILPHLVNPGRMMTISFIGKAFNNVEPRWKSMGNFEVDRKV